MAETRSITFFWINNKCGYPTSKFHEVKNVCLNLMRLASQHFTVHCRLKLYLLIHHQLNCKQDNAFFENTMYNIKHKPFSYWIFTVNSFLLLWFSLVTEMTKNVNNRWFQYAHRRIFLLTWLYNVAACSRGWGGGKQPACLC